MAGFRKAEPKQAYLKAAIYGPPGAGKTFTALLLAEGLAAGKRLAVIDTERGTDFYCQAVPQRKYHPEPFDFDALYTRSITEALQSLRGLDLKTYGVVLLDSVSHLWDAAIAAHSGWRTKAGTIPLNAWDKIKRPYKDLMAWCLNADCHVILCGRQGGQFEEDEETGELKLAGWKMRAEKETAHEPHLCIRMEAVRIGRKSAEADVPTAVVEKDRTGLLQGKRIAWPSFENVGKPLLGLLAGGVQAKIESESEAAALDAERLEAAERSKESASSRHREQWEAKLKLADSKAAVEAVGKAITPAAKKEMLPSDVAAVREAYLAALARFGPVAEVATNGA